MSDAPVALVGTTASGKSAVALEVARRRGDVELVCIDSMTVYRGMDLGTAKAPAEARAAVPHHLLDLVDPGEEFTVVAFQAAAGHALASIAARGRKALLVGGTGLYLRSVVDGLEIPGRFPAVAADLERQADEPDGLATLHSRLAALDPVAASRTTDANRRRIVRALEVTIGSGRPFSSYGPGLTAYPPTDVTLVGLPFDPDVVDRRIEERLRRWVAEGFVEEVARLANRPQGLSRTARQALGYRELLAHVEAGVPLEDCIADAVRRTRAFARRQWSWFRRDPRVVWVRGDQDPADVVDRALGPLVGPAGGRGERRGAAGCETVAMVQAAERRPAEGVVAPGAAPVAPPHPTVTLSKHEGAGNDFLVLVDPNGTAVVTASGARALCDRRRGVGADGLIVCRPSATADLEMVLFNADGTEAEMSGNGIRCLAQAAVAAGLVPPGTFTVATGAGVRTVDYLEGAGTATASVDMGRVTLAGEEPSPVPGGRARAADVGNPHLVVVVDAEPQTVDLAVAAASCAERYPGGVNLEVVQPGPGGDELRLRVWERGVGETLACGTGSCAAAVVARDWGIVGDRVAVHNPGGTLVVQLGVTDAEPVVLTGPVHHVADVVVATGALSGGAPGRLAAGEGR